MKPLSKPRPKSQYAGPSIFDVEWAGVSLDEAHEIRIRNVNYEAMTSIRENAHTLVLATATPLFTGTTVSVV